MKKIIFTSLILTIFLSISIVNAQAPYKIWSKLYNGTWGLQDSAISLSTNSNGELFSTGWSLTPGGGTDIVTIRYDTATGNILWSKIFSDAGEDKSAAITSDNGFVYITGWTFLNTNRDIITIKYNAATGDTVFVKKFNGTGNGGDYGRAITVDASGNVYITGRSDVGGTPTTQQKFTTVKYNASGNMQWFSVYNGPLSSAFDEALSIKVDASGNAYVTGYSGTSTLSTTFDVLTIKINGSDGSVAWAKRYNGTANSEDKGIAVFLDNAGNNIFVGGYASRIGLSSDYLAMKYTTNGDSVGAIFYSGPGSPGNVDVVNAMVKDPNDDIYLTGFGFYNGGYHYQTVKFNSALTSNVWLKQTAELVFPNTTAIAYDNSGFVYIAGTIEGVTGRDILTIRYKASDGNEEWRKIENGSSSGPDYGSSVVTAGSNNVYVAGIISIPPSDIYLVRYAEEPIGVKKISSLVPKDFNLEQNYPNPFNPNTNIKFDIPKTSFVNITVYDLLGREISVLVNENLKAGKYETDWNASGISSGVYFYKLSTDGFTATRKMIINK